MVSPGNTFKLPARKHVASENLDCFHGHSSPRPPTPSPQGSFPQPGVQTLPRAIAAWFRTASPILPPEPPVPGARDSPELKLLSPQSTECKTQQGQKKLYTPLPFNWRSWNSAKNCRIRSDGIAKEMPAVTFSVFMPITSPSWQGGRHHSAAKLCQLNKSGVKLLIVT